MTMKSVDLPHLRSVVLTGHVGSGKTTLAEQLLFSAGAIARLGRVDDGTAHLIASWKVLSQCFPRRKIAYDADASWCWLDVGDVVTLTDSELSIATKPALVLESSVTLGGRVALVLLVLDDSIGSPNASA